VSLLPVAQWLADTTGSIALHESLYMYAIVESIHVLTLCLFVGLASMLDLRLLGLTMRHARVSTVVSRFLPWLTASFIVMIVTGTLLFYAIPVRTYQSVWFRAKLIVLVLAGVNVWLFHSGIYRRVAEWDLVAHTPRAARRAGMLSLILWAAVIVSGRMIAYNWFDCDTQQSAFITWAAGCESGTR